jgi:transposase-like protein
MARPRSQIRVVCQNQRCDFYQKEKGKDIIKRARNSAGHQRYFCLHCKKYFVETKGTPLYNKKLSLRQIKQICKLLVEKNGIRSVERITKHHRDTIGRLLGDLAEHAERMTTYLVHDLGLSAYEVDELWTTIKKNKRKLSAQALSGLAKVKRGHIRASSAARTFG